MSITSQALHHHLKRLVDAQHYVVAYSGGVDSHVLLHLCSQLNRSCQLYAGNSERRFTAVYIDHGLHQNSKKWGEHCRHICQELGIPLTIIAVNAQPATGQSPEAAARIARYKAFHELLKPGECLLTGQHLNDQAETLLLQLIRGSGPKGLSSMPKIKPFAVGQLCRPLLDYSKKDILNYAVQHQLLWVEDDSNINERFERNFLRNSVFPILTERWPGILGNLSRTAELQAESQLLLDELARTDLSAAWCGSGEDSVDKNKLQFMPLLQLSPSRIKNCIRYWISCNNRSLPSRSILEQIYTSVLLAKEDGNPVVGWQRDSFKCEVRKYRELIYLLADSVHSDKLTLGGNYSLVPDDTLTLPGHLGKISLSQISANTGFDAQRLLDKPLSIRFRQGGERFKKSLNGHSNTLKHWFQEQGIPPWERSFIPLVYRGDELIQAGNEILDHSLKSRKTKNSILIHWISDELLETKFKNTEN